MSRARQSAKATKQIEAYREQFPEADAVATEERSFTRLCSLCHHRLVEVVTNQGEIVELDTDGRLETWAIAPASADDPHLRAHLSRGYVRHDAVCKGE